MGVDGLKTGHTEESGYGLAASVEREGRCLVLVVNGLKNVNERSREAERLLEWGFREFGAYRFLADGATVEAEPAWLGAACTVRLVLDENLADRTGEEWGRGESGRVELGGRVYLEQKKYQNITEI